MSVIFIFFYQKPIHANEKVYILSADDKIYFSIKHNSELKQNITWIYYKKKYIKYTNLSKKRRSYQSIFKNRNTYHAKFGNKNSFTQNK